MNLHDITLLQQLPLADLFTLLATALGCGLLIGLERERSARQNNELTFAGLRSFAICSVLGAICFLLGPAVGLVGALIVGGLTLSSVKTETTYPGITTELVFVMTYFIGAICLWQPTLAAGLSVIITIILMAKRNMHGVAGKWITEAEFKDGLFLLTLALIALPLTPNKALWGSVLNPYVILKLLVLILSVQALAHFAKRLLSSKNAMILSSLASGFVSSTATIASLGMEVRSGRADPVQNAGAALMSCVATLLQLLIVVAGVSMLWLKTILIPTLVATAVLALCALFLLRKSDQQQVIEQKDSRMFSLKEAGLIAVLLTVIQAMVYGLSMLLGDAGLIVGTLLASLFEIHAAMATVVMQGTPEHTMVFYAFILGMGIHAISKSINAFLTGGFKYACAFAPFQILHMVIFMALLWFLK